MAGFSVTDKLVDAIFSSIRDEQISAREKVNALVRAGQIARVYLGETDTLVGSVFGPVKALQHDLRPRDAAGQH